MHNKLYTKVVQLLRERPRSLTYRQIEDDTGLPEPWIKLVAGSKVKDPSVNRIEQLYEYLTGHPLEL